MALGTITQVTDTSQGTNVPQVASLKSTVATVVGDGSYPTGGSAITAAQLGLGTLVYAKVVGLAGSAANNGAVSASFNNATGKLQMWASTGTSPVGLAEVANAVNLSGLTVTLEALGY